MTAFEDFSKFFKQLNILFKIVETLGTKDHIISTLIPIEPLPGFKKLFFYAKAKQDIPLKIHSCYVVARDSFYKFKKNASPENIFAVAILVEFDEDGNRFIHNNFFVTSVDMTRSEDQRDEFSAITDKKGLYEYFKKIYEDKH